MVLATNKFKMKDATKQKLFQAGFRFHSFNKDSKNNIYVYTFPIHKYLKSTMVECEIITECCTGDTVLNFYDKVAKSIYRPFYGINTQQYSKKFLNSMDRKVKRKLKGLGIEWS